MKRDTFLLSSTRTKTMRFQNPGFIFRILHRIINLLDNLLMIIEPDSTF
jgi:hypothetical protein